MELLANSNNSNNVTVTKSLDNKVLRLMLNFQRKGYSLNTLKCFNHLYFDYDSPSSGSITIKKEDTYNSKRVVASTIKVPHHMDKLQAYLISKGVDCINTKDVSSSVSSEQASSISVVSNPITVEEFILSGPLQSVRSHVKRVSFSEELVTIHTYNPEDVEATENSTTTNEGSSDSQESGATEKETESFSKTESFVEPNSKYAFDVFEFLSCCFFGIIDGPEEKSPLLTNI